MRSTDPNDIMISGYERRRRAPFHFHAKADNARFNAYVLSHLDGLNIEAFARQANYGGNTDIALSEAFDREASLALELIVKAVIAQRLELGKELSEIAKVPASHNVPDLWRKARLPELSQEDAGRLVIARVYLMWASRYAAPNKDADGDRDHDDIARHATDRVSGIKGIRLVRRRSFNWDDVSRIYGIANTMFWQLRDDAGL